MNINKFSLIQQIIAYMKYERSNLKTYANATNSLYHEIVSWHNEPFDGSCHGHALSKVCQYVITNNKLVHELNYASIRGKDDWVVSQRMSHLQSLKPIKLEDNERKKIKRFFAQIFLQIQPRVLYYLKYNWLEIFEF
jgi:hypothetical protein